MLVTRRLPHLLIGVIFHALASAVSGLYLATWLGLNLGASVIIAGAGIFGLCWLISGFFRSEISAS
jgi:ABC-type Mn2+/Zn2+ transport system permease subunit